MIVRNFYQVDSVAEQAHGGRGVVHNSWVFGEGDFETPLRFIIYAVVEPGASIGTHTHGDNEEVYVILEGRGMMTVNGAAREVGAGDVILNKPGWSHGLENPTDGAIRVLVFEVGKGE